MLRTRLPEEDRAPARRGGTVPIRLYPSPPGTSGRASPGLETKSRPLPRPGKIRKRSSPGGEIRAKADQGDPAWTGQSARSRRIRKGFERALGLHLRRGRMARPRSRVSVAQGRLDPRYDLNRRAFKLALASVRRLRKHPFTRVLWTLAGALRPVSVSAPRHTYGRPARSLPPLASSLSRVRRSRR